MGGAPNANLSNRLNPNNVNFDREMAAQYRNMNKTEKEMLWARFAPNCAAPRCARQPHAAQGCMGARAIHGISAPTRPPCGARCSLHKQLAAMPPPRLPSWQAAGQCRHCAANASRHAATACWAVRCGLHPQTPCTCSNERASLFPGMYSLPGLGMGPPFAGRSPGMLNTSYSYPGDAAMGHTADFSAQMAARQSYAVLARPAPQLWMWLQQLAIRGCMASAGLMTLHASHQGGLRWAMCRSCKFKRAHSCLSRAVCACMPALHLAAPADCQSGSSPLVQALCCLGVLCAARGLRQAYTAHIRPARAAADADAASSASASDAGTAESQAGAGTTAAGPVAISPVPDACRSSCC